MRVLSHTQRGCCRGGGASSLCLDCQAEALCWLGLGIDRPRGNSVWVATHRAPGLTPRFRHGEREGRGGDIFPLAHSIAFNEPKLDSVYTLAAADTQMPLQSLSQRRRSSAPGIPCPTLHPGRRAQEVSREGAGDRWVMRDLLGDFRQAI